MMITDSGLLFWATLYIDTSRTRLWHTFALYTAVVQAKGYLLPPRPVVNNAYYCQMVG